MSTARYLDLLRAENEKICLYPELTKPTKPPLVSLVSSPPRHFQPKNANAAPAAIMERDGGFSDSRTAPRRGLDTLDTCSTGASRDFQSANEPSIDAGDEAAIRAWLAYIGEADEQIIGEVLTMCATDPAALDYYLGRADEADDADMQEAA